LKVLVVDDEKVIRDFLSRFLSLQLAQVKTASDGEAAIELAKTEEFDLVFLDIRMPKMNGLELIKAVREIDPAVVGMSIVSMFQARSMTIPPGETYLESVLATLTGLIRSWE